MWRGIVGIEGKRLQQQRHRIGGPAVLHEQRPDVRVRLVVNDLEGKIDDNGEQSGGEQSRKPLPPPIRPRGLDFPDGCVISIPALSADGRSDNTTANIEKSFQSRRRKQQDDGDQWMPIAGDHIEDGHRQCQARQHSVQNEQSPPVAAMHPHAEGRERQNHAETQPDQPAQYARVIGIRFDGLGIGNLGRVEREEHLLSQKSEPLKRLAADVGQRLAEPIVRHLAGRENPADRFRRETRGVVPFKGGIAALRQQRFVAFRRRGDGFRCRNSARTGMLSEEIRRQPGSS